MMKKDSKDFQERAYRVIFTQIQACVGIDKFGERALAALVKEFKKLNDSSLPGKHVVCAIDPRTLLKEDK